MAKQPDILAEIGLAAIFLLLVGLGTWRQYLKFLDGRGFASLFMDPGAPIAAKAVVFVVLPLAFVFLATWAAARDFK